MTPRGAAPLTAAVVAAALLVPAAPVTAAAADRAGTITRVSVSSSGEPSDEPSYVAGVSGDGQYVTFVSAASNLVPGDTNGIEDVFVHDRSTNRTERISVGARGREGAGWSLSAAISVNGRYVAFTSNAPNLVRGDTNDADDIFVRDRVARTTVRVSTGHGRRQGNGNSLRPSISDDGRYVGFESDASNLVDGDTNLRTDVFVHDRVTRVTHRASVGPARRQGNGASRYAAISGDGTHLAFRSVATNLVARDTNRRSDVFVRNMVARTTERVSVSTAGRQANAATFGSPSISRTGRYVVFSSQSSNLAGGGMARDVFLRDRRTKRTELVSIRTGGDSGDPSVSADGRYVAYRGYALGRPADPGEFQEVFVRDRTGRTTQQLTDGGSDSYAPAIAADGDHVAFSRDEERDRVEPVDAFIWDAADRRPGTISRVGVSTAGTPANPTIAGPLSAHGRYAVFSSVTPNLVPGDTNNDVDVFVRDRLLGTTERVSVSTEGAQGNTASGQASISPDGRFVAFVSAARNLVPGDTNDNWDIFLRDRLRRTTVRVSVGPGGRQANDSSGEPSVSADGRYVAFHSGASNLVSGDSSYTFDVFVRDLQANVTHRVSVRPGGRQADGESLDPAISADARYVAFRSDASNLVPGDTNGFADMFVRDLRAGVTERVSVGPGGRQADAESTGEPATSADGRYVAFTSIASTLAPGGTPDFSDVFVRDRITKRTERVAIRAGADNEVRSISSNGRYVACISTAPGTPAFFGDVFVRDRSLHFTQRLTAGGFDEVPPFISGDGAHVAFNLLDRSGRRETAEALVWDAAGDQVR